VMTIEADTFFFPPILDNNEKITKKCEISIDKTARRNKCQAKMKRIFSYKILMFSL